MQDRLRVLVAELQHRTRNLMAVVLGVMRRTKRGSPDLDRFAADFQNRLDALGRVQGLLSRLDEGDRVAFDELIRTELRRRGRTR
jgi:two-component system CheB/CheR fusion protein